MVVRSKVVSPMTLFPEMLYFNRIISRELLRLLMKQYPVWYVVFVVVLVGWLVLLGLICCLFVFK